MGSFIEVIAETFGAFGMVGVCTVVGGIAVFAFIKFVSEGK